MPVQRKVGMLKAKNGEKSEYANQKMPLQKSKKWAKIDCKGKKKNTVDRYVRDFDPNVLR